MAINRRQAEFDKRMKQAGLSNPGGVKRTQQRAAQQAGKFSKLAAKFQRRAKLRRGFAKAAQTFQRKIGIKR